MSSEEIEILPVPTPIQPVSSPTTEPKKKSTGRPKKDEEKKGPTQREMRNYIKENNLQKEFLEYAGITYGKANKEDLSRYIEVHKLELSLPKFTEPESVKVETTEEDVIKGNVTHEDDEIENIPIFTPSPGNQSNSQDSSEREEIRLNATQYTIKQYIQEFPTKVKMVTSRPTFNKEFAQVKEKYVDPQTGEEYKCPLLVEIEKEVGRVNALAFISSKSTVVIQWIEDFCDAVRRHKSVSEGGKIPDIVKSTIGNLRLNGWHTALASDPLYHDIIKEMLIKYGGDIEGVLSYLNVETRLAMVLIGSAYIVHKNNVRYEEEIKNKQSKEIPKQYKGM